MLVSCPAKLLMGSPTKRNIAKAISPTASMTATDCARRRRMNASMRTRPLGKMRGPGREAVRICAAPGVSIVVAIIRDGLLGFRGGLGPRRRFATQAEHHGTTILAVDHKAIEVDRIEVIEIAGHRARHAAPLVDHTTP